MLGFKLETLAEAKVILIFHVVGTAMEIFKTSAGSWIYPEESFFRIAAVPLFSGFMYAAVGSYLARVQRIFDMRYSAYPPLWTTVALCAAIYVNFFAHHFMPDLRYLLFAATAALYLRTVVHYRVFRFRHRMPLLLGFLLVALFIWFAENIGTWSRAWIYPGQGDAWTPVPIGKLGAWYLLMIISFVLVSLVHRPTAAGQACRLRRRSHSCARSARASRVKRGCRTRRGSVAEAGDRKLQVDLAGLLELERDRHFAAFLERLGHHHEHQMRAAWLQLDGGAGRYLEPALDRPHGHHVVDHFHDVDFDHAGARRGDREQAVGRGALVGDRQIAAADRLARQHGLGAIGG